MRKRSVRIFIVEDEVVIVRGLEDALQRQGYEVCGFAFSGEEALAEVERKRPDLALVDIYLKGEMDGIHLADRIMRRLRLPVIYLTAYSNKEILERAKKSRPYGYIVKPFRERQLKVNIELALAAWKTEQARNRLLEKYRRTTEALQAEIGARTRQIGRAQSELQTAARRADRQQRKLEQLRCELQEVNQALLSLTTQMLRSREELEVEVATNLRRRLLPFLRELEQDPSFERYRTEFDMLFFHLRDLSSNLAQDQTSLGVLSPTELRVATLIKHGMTSNELARTLHVSLDTIKTHRRNIRKKLGICNTSTHLATFLQSCWRDS